jgi:glycine oxidase
VTNVIPLGEKKFKLSSTFSWEPLDWKTTESARTSLSNDFKSLFDSPFKVIDQQAALRPTVADRRPYLGEHPEFKNLYIFNGLGSKGVMLAPYFSKHLLEHITEGKPLLNEVDIIRHKKRFLNRNLDESSLDKNH